MAVRPLLLALLSTFAAIAPGVAAEPRPTPALRIQSYAFKLRNGTILPAERGTFSVPEDRRNPKSRKIEIGFVRFKSTNPHPGAPIIYLAGGPGGSGVGAAEEQRQPIFLALRQVADVIALDQRGVGLSNHIPPCTAPKKFDPAVTLSEASLTTYYRDTLHYCEGEWRKAGVTIAGYNTVQSADDIERLRQLLGVSKVDLWGISYGTHLALATMRRHPKSIGRAVLASVEGMNQTVKLPLHVDAPFHRIEAVLAGGDPAKANLTRQMAAVHAKLDAEPETFTIQSKQGSISFRTDSFPIKMLASVAPKNPDGIAQLVGAYAALDAGKGNAIAPLLFGYFLERPLTLYGMAEAMDIASGITDSRLLMVRARAVVSLLGTATNFPMPQLRGELAGADLGDAYREEVRSDIPTLVFSGDLDVRTPLEEQAEAIAGLTNKHQIIVHNGGHDLFEAHPDIPGIMIDFLSGKPVTRKELTLPAPAAARQGG